MLGEVLLRHQRTAAYVFRPCVVAGPRAQMLLEEMPYYRLSGAVPDAVVGLLSSMPILKPVIPDPGMRFQLVHEDDVATAFLAGVRGQGEPGAYNLAGRGTIRMSDVADALGWYSIPVPDAAVDATAGIVDRLPLAPESVSWIHAIRRPVLMKIDHARDSLKWKPEHTAKATLKAMVAARRAGAAGRPLSSQDSSHTDPIAVPGRYWAHAIQTNPDGCRRHSDRPGRPVCGFRRRRAGSGHKLQQDPDLRLGFPGEPGHRLPAERPRLGREDRGPGHPPRHRPAVRPGQHRAAST